MKFWLILMTCAHLTYAQLDSANTATQIWLDFNPIYPIDQQWTIYGDGGYRIIFGNKDFHRLYIRSGGSYQLDEVFILHAGMGLFTTFDAKSTLWEFRPFQGLEIRWPTINRFPIFQYIRLEERFFNENSVSSFILRGRYQLSTNIRFNQDKIQKYFFVPLQLEWFVNIGDDIDFHANEVRAIAGIGYVFDLLWRAEFDLIYENLRTSADERLALNDIILRLRIYRGFNPLFIR